MGGKKKSLGKKKPDVSKELEGLDIEINSLGEIQSTYDVDKINEFLDSHVDDKKLHNLEHQDEDVDDSDERND